MAKSHEGTNPRYYVVEHSMVGTHMRGDVVRFNDEILNARPAEIDRLVGLGAIREASKDETENAVDWGTGGDLAAVFPPVPFQASATEPAAEETK